MTLLILISLHMMADFYFQSTSLANKKSVNKKYLLLHSVIYTIVFALRSIFVYYKVMFIPFAILTVSHLVIDFIRVAADKKWNNKKFQFASFLTDQLLHIALIITVYYCFKLEDNHTEIWRAIINCEKLRKITVYAVIMIIIWEPAAVLIKKLLYTVSGSFELSNSNAGAGKLIGELERVIIAVLVITDQLSVIGFVLTAKSLARFKQLENKNFAEKYLIRTLMSTAIAIVTTLILMKYL